MWGKRLCSIIFAINSHLVGGLDFRPELIRKYAHNSEMQRRWAISFMAPHLKDLKGNERILDVGCGDGKITADLSRFVSEGEVLGIDPCIGMLEWAKKQYGCLEYPNLSFQEGSFLSTNAMESFDLIFSNCALHHVKDQYSALKKMAKLLKPNGKLLIVIPAFDNVAWNLARAKVQALEKFRAHFSSGSSKTVLREDEYQLLLEQIGLFSQRVEKVFTLDLFVDAWEFKEFLKGTICPKDEELFDEFYEACIEEYRQLQPEAFHENGVIEFRLGKIEIEAVLKNENS